MKLIQRVIYTGFAAIALTAASMPVWPASTDSDRGCDPGIPASALAQAAPTEEGFDRR